MVYESSAEIDTQLEDCKVINTVIFKIAITICRVAMLTGLIILLHGQFSAWGGKGRLRTCTAASEYLILKLSL